LIVVEAYLTMTNSRTISPVVVPAGRAGADIGSVAPPEAMFVCARNDMAI
jgi:hypothetical protein